MATRLLLLTLLVCAAWPPLAPAAFAAGDERPRYHLDVEVDWDAGRVGVAQRVEFTNRHGEPLHSVLFNVVPAFYQGAFTLQEARLDGLAVPAVLDGTLLELTPPEAIAGGALVVVELRYELWPPQRRGRFGWLDGVMALGNWFPILAVYSGGWERHQYTEVGDSFHSEVADFEVEVSAPPPLVVAHSGEAVTNAGGRWALRAANLRDFALVIGADFHVAERQEGATLLQVYTAGAPASAAQLEALAALVRWYSDLLGPYPYPTLTVASVDLGGYAGMEYPTLVMLEPRLLAVPWEPNSYAHFILAHEVAHQWFYGLVGNDEIRDAWLDEAFATYLPLLYYREQAPGEYESAFAARVAREGDQRVLAAGDRPLNSTVDDFTDEGDYFAIAYRKGAGFLAALEAALGPEAFREWLRRLVAGYRFRVATTPAALALAQDLSAADLEPLFARYFDLSGLRVGAGGRLSAELRSQAGGPPDTVALSAGFAASHLEVFADEIPVYSGEWREAVPLDPAGWPAGAYLLRVRVQDAEGRLAERHLWLDRRERSSQAASTAE